MAEMQSLAEEQRKAGLLLDDGAPVKLSISAAPPAAPTAPAEAKPAPKAAVFGAEEEEEMVSKRKGPLVKLDFGLVDAPETRKERLEKIRAGLSKEKDVLFKTKIRWEALSDVRTTLFIISPLR
jgi:RNA-binding protein 25